MERSEEIKITNGKVSIKNQKLRPTNYIKEWKSAQLRYKKISAKLVFQPAFLFDQRPISFDSRVTRAKKLLDDFEVCTNSRTICFIGDDDFVSILAALVFKDKKICVFDIDSRIIKSINAIAKTNRIRNLVAAKLDFSKHIPEKYSNVFDVFVSDPSPQPKFFKSFMVAAKRLIKKGGIGYICFYPSHSNVTIDFQEILTDLGFVVVEMIDKYTEYDFRKESYEASDFELLKKYRFDKKPIINFYENITKLRLVPKTTQRMDPAQIPRATLLALKSPANDPAFNQIEKDKELRSFYNKMMKGAK